MKRKNMTDTVHVTRAAFDLVVKEFPSLSVEEKAQWTKLEGAKGRKVYLPKTKTVRRVDIAGFEVEPSMAMVPKQGVFGAVKQQLRLHGTEVDILNRFRKLLSTLVSLTAVEKAAKAKIEKVKPAEVVKTDLNSPEEIAKRLERIKAYSKATGIPVSSKVAQADS